MASTACVAPRLSLPLDRRSTSAQPRSSISARAGPRLSTSLAPRNGRLSALSTPAPALSLTVSRPRKASPSSARVHVCASSSGSADGFLSWSDAPSPQGNGEAPLPLVSGLGAPVSPTHVILAAAMAASAAAVAAAKRLASHLRSLFSPMSPREQALLQTWQLNKMKYASTLGPLFFASISQAGDSTSNSTPLTVIASGMAKWLELYSGLLLIRVLLSWFPNIDWERQPLQAIRDMSDPYLNLFRNIMPPFFGALDLSPMLAFLVLGMLSSLLNTTLM